MQFHHGFFHLTTTDFRHQWDGTVDGIHNLVHIFIAGALEDIINHRDMRIDVAWMPDAKP